MNAAQALIEQLSRLSAVERIGWVLLHSLWQETAVALLCAAGLFLLGRGSAARRYVIACAAMMLMAVAPIATAALALAVHEPGARASSGAGGAVFLQPSTHHPVIAPDGLSPASASESFLPLLLRSSAYAWLIGASLVSVWNLLGWSRVQRMKRGSAEAPPTWEQVLAGLSRELRVRAAVRLRVCRRVWAPAVVGWVRPVILVPLSALTELPPQHIEALLAHELAHVRRHDYLVNLLQTAIEMLLFYHPAVWWVGWKIRQERENCCDDIAVEHCGSAVRYARALAAAAELRWQGVPSLALSAGGGSLLRRIERLVSPRTAAPRVRPLGPAVVLLAALTVIAVVCGRTGATDQKANAATTRPSASAPASQPAISEIRADDLVAPKGDYLIHPNDLLSVTLSDLNGPNTETVKQCRVTESGMISVPYLEKPIKAAGLNEAGLEKAIVAAYRVANLIAHANVGVHILEARGRAYEIIGQVQRPGQYIMPESDFRLLQAIAAAGGTAGPTTSVRVVRREKGEASRVVEVPADKLFAGNPNVDMVIHSGDVVLVNGGDAPVLKSVRITVAKDGLIFQGHKTDWPQIEEILEKIVDRGGTTVEIAPESDEVTVGKLFDARSHADQIVKRLGLKGLTLVPASQ